jgi:2-polyprenyl-6-methoxyphenol hydroxylase-like FAD-dependent oxidoreductase
MTGEGGKRLGDWVAGQPLCAPNDKELGVGAGLLHLTQAKLNKVLLEEAVATGKVKVRFGIELVGIVETGGSDGVVIQARNSTSGEETLFQAQYVVGADGAHSATRRALGISFPGHTWSERIIATDVEIHNAVLPDFPTHFVMDSVHYAIAVPLSEPFLGQKSLWRYALATDPEDNRPDSELLEDENIMGLYERNMAGKRPLNVYVKRKAVYKIHQRLAPTLRRGRCVLVGDAAHVNNVNLTFSLVHKRH